MIPLKTTRRVLTWLCMCLPDAPLTVFEKFTHYSLASVCIADIGSVHHIFHTRCFNRFNRIALCSDQYLCKLGYCLFFCDGLHKSRKNQYDFQAIISDLSSSYVKAVLLNFIKVNWIDRFVSFQQKTLIHSNFWPI